MSEPSQKRRKLTKRGEDDYLPGNITEIQLQNFMTFDVLTCKPNSRLNIVIGPNGSGKSSLVCAIALGLGGEPQLLGRATSVGAYVKRGEESGFIKITLRGETVNEEITIVRKIDTHNKSEWVFNGKVVPKKDVLECIQKFNIQVNNLTQFLPQDRVCEFAKLTPIQLLEETEKAVGDPQLPIQHNALVDKSRELKRLELTVKQNGDTLNQLKALNAEQERDVERVRQRGELLAKVETMRKKLPWLKYEQIKEGYLEAVESEKDAKRKLDEAAKILNDLKLPIEKEKKVKAMQESAYKKVSNLISNNAKKRMELLENESHLGVQVRGKYNEMEDLRRQEQSRQQRISKAKDDLAAAELELAQLPAYEPPKSEVDRLAAQILELDVAAKQKGSQKVEKENLLGQKRMALRQCQSRLKDMENVNNKLLQALQRSGAEKIFEAYRWLQEHRSELKKEVYGPVLLEVNVPDRDHAAYLEKHVAYYIWKSFITQDAADRDFLVRSLKSFDVPIVNYAGDNGNHKQPFELSGEMHNLGIYSRLDQIFNAPFAVKEVLTSQFGLENSYIGSRETDRKADRVPGLGISDLWTPENHYRWSTSRYGGHVSATVEAVSPSDLFLCSSDVGEIEKLRSRKKELEETIFSLEGSLKTIQTEQRHLEDEAGELRKQREELLNTIQFEKKKRRNLENLICQRKKKLESMENEDDVETNIQKLIELAARLNTRRFENAIDIKNMLMEAVAMKRSFAEKYMAFIELDTKIRILERNLKDQNSAVMNASMHFEQCKKEAETRREQLALAKRDAESIAYYPRACP